MTRPGDTGVQRRAVYRVKKHRRPSPKGGNAPIPPQGLEQPAETGTDRLHVRRRAIEIEDRKEVNPLIEYLNSLFADLKEESGQTMAEYAVVLGVITIAVVATLTLLSSTISTVLNNVINKM
jgi:Flp pilus assembly pilin Flp